MLIPSEPPVEVLPQPDDTTCGPTCLHAIYRHFGDDISLDDVIEQCRALPGGGTLAVLLGCHALEYGYEATIYTYNLHVFDPTWFVPGVDLAAKLRAQRAAKPDPKLAHATAAYLEFLELGGVLRFEELTTSLLDRLLADGQPVLTGLSATYLYACSRELGGHYDDVRGEPMGHFVVLSASEAGDVAVADPLEDNPGYGERHYAIDTERLIAAILLGIVTYDANLLVLRPKRTAQRKPEDGSVP